MESSIFRQVTELAREHKTAARAMAVFLCLALVVTAATVGILTFTGHAMTRQVKVLTCPLVVHEHTPSCKNAEGELVCGYADYVVHVHNDDCYDENDALVCPLPEVWPHTHDDSCYEDVKTPVCGQEEAKGHEHTEECYLRERGELTCTQEEHTHGDACFKREEVLTCDKTEQDHIHSDACYAVSRELSCGEEESETHTHSDACYTEVRTLICDKTKEPHNHGPECYTVNETLICEIPEHTHTDDCYAWTETLICQIPEGQIPEGGHVHTDECYETRRELTCGKLEKHEHSDACFVLDGAGNRTGNPVCGQIELLEHVHGEGCFTMVEQAEGEDGGLFFFETTGDDPEVSAPEPVCGKDEHTHDESCLDENGELVCGLEEHTHEDSCYSGAPEETAPPEESPVYLCGKDEHTHDDSCLDESGELVCGLEEHTHDESCLTAPEGVTVKTWKDAGTLITARYTDEAQLPEDAVLQAYRVTPEQYPDRYEERVESALDALGEGSGAGATMLVYNIGFFTVDGEEVEPLAPVTITIQFLDADGLPTGSPVKVVHFGKDGVTTMDGSTVDGSNSTSFVTDSFSDFSFLLPPFLDDIVVIGGSGNEESGASVGDGNMADLLHDVNIVTEKGEEIKDGKLFVGEKYRITLNFAEGGAQSAKQFKWTEDGTMTFQLPANFKVEAKSDVPLTIKINNEDVEIGTYAVTEDGKLVVTLNEKGKSALKEASNAQLDFEMDATVEAGDGSDGGHIKFNDAGENFDFEVVDQARVEVDKQGKYTEYTDSAEDTEGTEGEGTEEQGGAAARRGGRLEYTVTTTVKRGSVSDLSVLDELTPPNTSALDIKDVNPDDIKVTLKKRGVDGAVTEIVLTKDTDYELVEVPDTEHPGKKTFQVKLKEGSTYSTLNEGDVLEVTYPYKVEYVKGSTDVFWGNVANDVHVTGKGKVPAPADDPEKETPEIDIDEHRGSNVEIQVTPPGDGIIFKTQEFSEADHKLHYTLYTTVPAGTWNPFFILDDMVVEFGGQKYNLMEFKKDGRVSNLKVSAVDVENDELGNWSDSTDEQRQRSLEELKENAKQLTGYDMTQFDEVPDAYDPNSLDNYICLWLNNNLEIVFGKFNQKSLYGTWKYEKDRLIITEYDLDMSDDRGPLSLVDTSDYQTTIAKEASEVLLAGIRNTVHMRFDGYNPGYSVFFNNAERMNKTGVPDKSDNSITWTVTMNTTDTTVNKYFQDVTDDWMAYASGKYNWANNKAAYSDSMQAVFYDVLPDGWEYVEGSLTATACDTWGNKASYPYNGAGFYDFHDLVTQDGDKQVIRAPLMFFNDTANKGRPNLFDWFGNDLASLTFTYKLKATDEWIRDHATDTNAVEVHNYADIRDNLHPDQPHWTASTTVPYLPQHLSKTAVQVGDSNLLQFTLHVNPASLALDSKKGYLVVTDTSTNLQIQKNSIKVTDAAGTGLTLVTYKESMTLGENEWALMPETESGQFKLMVPDGKALLVTYNALIPELGTGISVSNKAGIEGVVNADSGFNEIINVNSINGGGSGSTYALDFQKVDSTDRTKTLSGAEFKFYIVLDDTEDVKDKLEETKKITVGGKEYSCHSEESWTFTTNEKGVYSIPSGWNLAQGNYYILEELKAPAGYAKLEEPILFYFGAENQADKENHPNAVTALPNSTLTIADPPVPYSLPESGGPGSGELYILGGALILASLTLYCTRPRKKESEG